MHTLHLGTIPAKLWLDDVEAGATAQIKNLSNLPFAFSHIAIMPDSHQGYGMPIGGVLATRDVIVPNAVGVDIGCGMCAVRTSLLVADLDAETLKLVMGDVRKAVPVGFSKHETECDLAAMPELGDRPLPVVRRELPNARKSLGTLGGGNHFIEIQKGSDGHIWVMIHSGSRNLGKQVCDHYNALAVELNKTSLPSVPAEWELAYLPVDSPQGKDYAQEMAYCLNFAFANRKAMMARIMEAFAARKPGISFGDVINIHHNYAALERHFGQDVWVHRKGATLATKETVGLIPGSQGTKSYVVRGKGNPDSFNSCSHGAGRRVSRAKAQAELDLKTEIRRLDDLGVVHGIRNQKDLDEAAGAYKDIDVVMNNQRDLVDVLVELTPYGVIKG